MPRIYKRLFNDVIGQTLLHSNANLLLRLLKNKVVCLAHPVPAENLLSRSKVRYSGLLLLPSLSQRPCYLLSGNFSPGNGEAWTISSSGTLR